MDRAIGAVSMATAMLVAHNSAYAWYWQVAIIIAIVIAVHGIALAIQTVLAPRNK